MKLRQASAGMPRGVLFLIPEVAVRTRILALGIKKSMTSILSY